MLKTLSLIAGLSLATAAMADDFTLASKDITGPNLEMAQFANGFGCTGGNVSPELHWSGAPAGTQSFVISLYDPDAATGSGWWHWTVANIPADVTSLPTGAGSDPATDKLPQGAVMTNTDMGQPGFLGACPPPGEPHHYRFTIKALNVPKLDITPNATGAMLGFMSNAVKIGEAHLDVIGLR